jgi:MFS family permease
VFAASMLWSVLLMPLEPDYFGRWLPASLLTGLGVALTFPVLSAAAVAGLPPERFGVGGAVNQTARQMGAVLGVALLVAILGTPGSPGEALDAFQQAWLMAAGAGVLSAVIATRLRHVEAVVPAAAVVAAEPATA